MSDDVGDDDDDEGHDGEQSAEADTDDHANDGERGGISVMPPSLWVTRLCLLLMYCCRFLLLLMLMVVVVAVVTVVDVAVVAVVPAISVFGAAVACGRVEMQLALMILPGFA